MTAGALSRPQRVFLLCALAFCLVTMHHFIATTGMPAMSPSTTAMSAGHGQEPTADVTEKDDGHPAEPHGEHGFLHLCLAVLGAIGVLIALLGLFFRLRRIRPSHRPADPAGPRAPPAPARPPDRRGRRILNSLCVLRV